MRLTFSLILFLFACSSKPTPPTPEILPCFRAGAWKEFSRLEKIRAKNPNKPLIVAGKKYACVESSLEVESLCYMAKTKKEFDKLSREQEKRPAWPIQVGKKYFRCIQKASGTLR